MDLNVLMKASEKGADFLVSKLKDNGQFLLPEANEDFSAVYKLPMLLLLSGRGKLANQVLDNIKERFMLPSGDFVSHKSKPGREQKTANGALAHFWVYMNGWVAMAAHRAGRFDISYPAFNYMKTFYNPIMKSANCSESFEKGKGQEIGIFISSHVGLAVLYFGDLKLAKDIGDSVVLFIDEQPNIKDEFLIRRSSDTKAFVPEGPDELSPFYKVKITEANQLYFLLGYPVLFLYKLYLATKDDVYIIHAQIILDFLLKCDETIYSFHYSHKVAYAAYLVAKETKNPKYKELSERITQHLLSLQSDEGDFLKSASVLDNFDQTTEISIWLREISAELTRL